MSATAAAAVSILFTRVAGMTIGHEGASLDLTYGDRGNWTGGKVGIGELRGSRFGISAASYPTVDIAALTYDGALDIYDRDYFSRVRGDDLPPPLALLVFDAAVNNGVPRASHWLQLAVGAHVDGIVGDETVASTKHAVTALGWQAVAMDVHAHRLDFMARDPDWAEFGLGWARRLVALTFQASQLAGAV